MKQYDAYLFDMDGTVIQTLVPWMDIVLATLAQYDIEANKKKIVRTVFGDVHAGLVELGVPADDLPAILESWKSVASSSMPRAQLYPHMATMLEELKRANKKLGLVTATDRLVVDLVLEARQLTTAFDVVVTGSDISAHKPNPEGILYALDHLGVAKESAVMLGDSDKDIRAANNAGIDSVLFFPPEHAYFHTLVELQADNPTHTIQSWQEMLGRLQ